MNETMMSVHTNKPWQKFNEERQSEKRDVYFFSSQATTVYISIPCVDICGVIWKGTGRFMFRKSMGKLAIFMSNKTHNR